jgi:hypothetical protein
VVFTLDRYGHLFPDSDTELSSRLSGIYRGSQLKLVDQPEADEAVPTASSRPETAEIIFLVRGKDSVDRDAIGGARKNRTFDLSIISAAL